MFPLILHKLEQFLILKKVFAHILLSLFLCGKTYATHIVGGEIFYDRINDSTYKVTVKVYRNCFNGLAPFAGVTKWQYLFGDGSGSNYSSDSHIYQQYGDYKVTQHVSNFFNCTDTISHIIKILPEFRFWVPNAFSPDGNSLNERFIPITMGVTEYKFDVFSRWGELVYSTQDPKEGWNGLYKGKDCEQDVYAWRVVFKNVVSNYREIHYGHILLLKNK